MPTLHAARALQPQDPYAHELFTSIAVSALARPKILFDIALAGSKITSIPALRDGLYAVISQVGWRGGEEGGILYLPLTTAHGRATYTQTHYYLPHTQALDNALVTPNKILIQKAPDNHDISFPHAVGIMHCNVLQAENLPAADWGTGQCDPYVKIVLASKGNVKAQEANTKMIEANRFPVYNEHFEFRVFREASDYLELSVWDYDTLTSHDFLGKAQLRLRDAINGVEQNGGKHVMTWLPLGPVARIQVVLI